MDIDQLREDLHKRLPVWWKAWISQVGVRFTAVTPEGNDVTVERIHGGAWEVTVGWHGITDYDGEFMWVHESWGEVLAKVTELGATR